jgi:hypothetical protein
LKLLALPARIPGQMPLVPLYDQNASDGSHHVRAPGGYETWRLCTYDAKENLFLSFSLWNGWLLDRDYMKTCRRYRKNPTGVSPPVPGDFACQVERQVSCVGLHSRVGGIPAITSFPNPTPAGLEIELDLARKIRVQSFASSPSAHLTTLNSSHHWELSKPLAQVQVEFDGGRRVPNWRTDSLGFCDHRYGTSPLNSDFFIDGCAFFPSGIFVFQATRTTSWVVQLTQAATALIDEPLEFHPRRDAFWRGYPTKMALGDRAALNTPNVIQHEPFHSYVSYEARAGNESGRSFCDIYTRMTWPLMLRLPRPEKWFPITWSPLPPADKSSPSGPERARGPFSSP